MIVEKNVAIPLSDGAQLRCNIYRPENVGPVPVLMCLGIYGKDIHFEDGYPLPWAELIKLYPNIDKQGSTGRYLRWEMPDPDRWVPMGYAIVTVDARGSGQSPGFLDPLSSTETRDYHEAIEWAGTRDWSNGKVGLLGISYLAITQWQVASTRPPHLAAICPWEGGSDIYRDWSHHGGILSAGFPTAWMGRQVIPNQHGNGFTHHRDRETGQLTTGPAAFGEDILRGNRADHAKDLLSHPLDDAWYGERSPRLDRIEVPLLSAGNWGGIGLHLRGNIEGYLRAASPEKWLFIHIGTHFESFYLPQYIRVQKQFFDHYLKGEDNGWTNRAPVTLEIRSPDGAVEREEQAWPLERTIWTRYYLNPAAKTLDMIAPSSASRTDYAMLGTGLNFSTSAFERDTEFTGPLAARLHMSSTTTDLDIFATLRLFDPSDEEVVFIGASEKVPVTRGWLRASHRKADPERSQLYRPWLTHDEFQPLEPNEVYALDVEIWPTSILVPKGYRLVLTLQGKDFEFPGLAGRMLHDSAEDRPQATFGGTARIVSDPDAGQFNYILMPRIPS